MLDKAGVKVGDWVKIRSEGLELSGILMPRIELGDPSNLIIKLSSGYNIGIRGVGAELSKIPKTGKLEQFPRAKPQFDPSLPSISMIATGGTISSRIDYRTGGVTFLMDPNEILFTAPELARSVNIVDISSPFKIGSEDMTPKEWMILAKEAEKKLNKEDIRGVILTHGTDTLHFTAAALSFMLRDLNKPVALVGAQRSPDRGSFDGTMNLICAANYAAHSNIAEVAIIMHGTTNDDYCNINRGTKVRKMHTSRRDAFRSINSKPIGRVWTDGRIELNDIKYRERTDKPVKADAVFEEKVGLVKVYPGIDPSIIDWYADHTKGFIIEGTGLGHPPSFPLDKNKSLFPAIKRAIDKGVFVGMTSQCLYGRVHSHVYNNAILLEKMGVTYLEDMLPEVAYVKLGWVLAHTRDPTEVAGMMLTKIAGEINPRHEPEDFLI